MDLKHDWKALNEVLFQTQNLAGAISSLVLVEDDNKIIDGIVSNGRAFTDSGMASISSQKDKLDELAAKYGVDQTIVLPKNVLDQSIIEAAVLGTNYFQQLQTLRANVLGQMGRRRGKEGPIVSRRHFVLDLFGVKLKRTLPRRFNVVLFIDERPSSFSAGSQGASAFSYRSILLSYSSGQLDQFFEPDFSSLHEGRLVNWQTESDAIGQYLESRYILPCYGIFMNKEEWERCLEAASQKRRPWGVFTRFYDEGRASVYPKSMLTKALLATQRVMVYFGRL
jgi:hypothetical protein